MSINCQYTSLYTFEVYGYKLMNIICTGFKFPKNYRKIILKNNKQLFKNGF